MTLLELQTWMVKNREEDSWWIALDGVVQDNVMTLREIDALKDSYRTRQLSVLHVNQADRDDAEWIIYEKKPAMKVKLAAEATSKKSFSVTAHKPAEPLPAPTPEKPAKKETQTIGIDASQLAVILEELNALRDELKTTKEEMKRMKVELNGFKTLTDDLKEPIVEAHKLLQEREGFLEIGENALFDKAQKQEVLLTELEQLREELNKRELYIDEQERELAQKKKKAIG